MLNKTYLCILLFKNWKINRLLYKLRKLNPLILTEREEKKKPDISHLTDLPKSGGARHPRLRQACNGHKMGERTQRNLTTKVRYFVYYDFTTLNGAKSYMKSPQFAILKYFEDLKIFRRPCSWFEVTSRSWNFSKIANSLGFLPRPARPLCFLHASLHYSAGSLASLILPKKVQNLTPREVSTAMYRLY